MQKDFDDQAGQMQTGFDEKVQLAQDAANLHATKQVENVAKEVEMVALRTQQIKNTEYNQRLKETAESHRLRVEKEAKSKLEALDAAQTAALEAQRVAVKAQGVAVEAQGVAVEAQGVARLRHRELRVKLLLRHRTQFR
jgi:hypothetical protein